MKPEIRTLLIVSHSAVYEQGGRLFAYGPYVKELNLWAELFPAVILASPKGEGAPPRDSLPIEGSNVSLAAQPSFGGKSWRAKLGLLIGAPRMVFALVPALWKADAIHVRAPGNLGGLGILLAPLFCRRLVAKYAGQWQSFPGEPNSSKAQRRLLSSRWWRGPVTVYGDWPGQPEHVRPFFTSILSEEQVLRAKRAANRRRTDGPLRVVFVGRLSKAKNVDVVLRAIQAVSRRGRDVRLVVVGHGPHRDELERLTDELAIRDLVEFAGGLPHDQALEAYERSDVQVLVSECEGWPKATAEAMAFGLIAIGSDRGFVPQMLGDGRGLVVPVRDVAALAERLDEIARDPEAFEPMRRRAAEWGQRQSLDSLRAAIAELLSRSWKAQIGAPRKGQPGLAPIRADFS